MRRFVLFTSWRVSVDNLSDFEIDLAITFSLILKYIQKYMLEYIQNRILKTFLYELSLNLNYTNYLKYYIYLIKKIPIYF